MVNRNLLFLFIIFLYFSNIKAQNYVAFNEEVYPGINCSTKGNTTLNSPYQSHLKIFMSSLHSQKHRFLQHNNY